MRMTGPYGRVEYAGSKGSGSAEDPYIPEVLDISLESYATIDSTLRVGSVTTIGDYKQILGKDTILFDEQLSGGATSVFEQEHDGVKMSVFADGDYVIRETKMAHNYVSGNPHIFEQTTIDMTPVAGVVKEMGYFSTSDVAPFEAEKDGFALVTDDTTIYLKVCKRGVEIFSAAQADWDDPLDGTGPSGLTVDPSAFNVLIGEFLFLGGTVFRAGFIVGPEVTWFHTFKNSNHKASVFVGSPTQPLRWSIRSTGGAGSFYHICGKVGTIGQVAVKGISRLHSNGATFINANVKGTTYALLGIRPSSRFVTVNPAAIGGMAGTADQFLLEIRLNPVIAGTVNWVDPGGHHHHDEFIGAPNGSNTVTNGIVLGGMYITNKSTADISLNNLLRPGCTIDGVHDELVLCATPLGANLNVYGSMQITIQP